MRQLTFILAAGLLLLMLIADSGMRPRAQAQSGATADPNSKTFLETGAKRADKTAARPGAGLSKPDPALQGRVLQNYGKLPLSFEANQGQTDPRVKFLSRGSGYTLFLTGDEAVLTLKKQGARRQKPEGSRQSAAVVGRQLRRSIENRQSKTENPAVLTRKRVGASSSVSIAAADE
jgi:hypothetical protein